MGQRWLNRLRKLKKLKVIKLRLTKKYFKSLIFDNSGKRRIKKRCRTNNCLNFLKVKKRYYFLLKYRQLLQRFLSKIKLKELKKLYFKANRKKTRLYLFNYISLLELRLNSILYHSFLIQKIALIKYLLESNLVIINNQSDIKASGFITNVLDIIGLDVHSIINDATNKKKKHSMFYFTLQKRLKKFQIRKFFNYNYIKKLILLKKRKTLNYNLRFSILRNFNFLFKPSKSFILNVLLMLIGVGRKFLNNNFKFFFNIISLYNRILTGNHKLNYLNLFYLCLIYTFIIIG